MAALGNALTNLDVSICSPHAQEAGLDSTQTTVDSKLAHHGPHLNALFALKDVVGSQFRRSGIGNLACEASVVSVYLASSSTRPNWVLANRVFDPQDDRQHLPQSAVSLWETLDSKTRTHQLHPLCYRPHGSLGSRAEIISQKNNTKSKQNKRLHGGRWAPSRKW